MTVAFFSCVCLRNSVHSALLFAFQQLPDAPYLFLCQCLACIAVLVYLNINYWCEQFVCDREAPYGSIVGHVLSGVSLVIDTGISLSLSLPETEE
jgi:hypothetical protein